MLTGQDIIFVSSDDWESGLKTSKYHMTMQLANHGNRVLFVESIGLRPPTASSSDLSRIGKKLAQWSRFLRWVHPNIAVLTPIVLPFHQHRSVQRLNRHLLVNSVKLGANRLGFKEPLLWNFMPNALDLVGRCNEQLSLYYCVDEFAQFPGVPVAAIEAMEQELLGKVDMCFATALKLYDDKQKFNSETHYMPHGVDVEHFRLALSDETPLADEIAALPKPVIGYYGHLAEWFDADLIEQIAKAHPEWSVVLIGTIRLDTSRYDAYPNVHFLGRKPYEDLPSYSKGFDVALIPFTQSKLTVNVNPLKLREYLASGLPVVSVDLPEVRKYAEVVHIASDSAMFIQAIEQALQENSPELIQYRTQFVNDESWEGRFELASTLIQDKIQEKQGRWKQ